MELFAGLIAEDPSQITQWLSHLRAGIRQLSGTVNNVLSIQSNAALRHMPVQLATCIEGGVEFVRPIADQAGVSLSFCAVSGDLTILGNENVIRQIVLNLVCNAIRHTASGGEIQVTVRGESRDGALCALVDVADTGRGIPEQWIGKIFDAGFSASGDTPGLGLAVCKRLMNQHGGQIRVSSRENCGTTFQLEFPTI
jgi:two-component system sensor histidine kinase FlrB